jgi:hypothetical protein
MDQVHIPDEVFAVLQWEDENLPAICVVNQSLAKFEPKAVFAWHLSITVDCKKLDANGMPKQAEKVILDKIANECAKNLKAHGNALFLARTAWNGTQQQLYRVRDSDFANAYLVDTITEKSLPREFTFRMEHDETWNHAKWYLQRCET